jgi:hypothetical protein
MNSRRVLAGLTAALIGSPALASTIPLYFDFTQGGFSNGMASGWFYGVDADDDGVLTTEELTDFQFNFDGTQGSSYRSLAVPVAQMFTGGTFRFQLDDLVLGDAPGEQFAAGVGGTYTAGFSYAASSAGGTFSSPPGFPLGVTATSELVQVTVASPPVGIPEPSPAALLACALAALAWRRRR